jgi:serine/threonine protein kinase
VHLDIKPDNITINSSGKIKFIDAGSLTKLSIDPNDIIKSTFGSPGYMSEQRTRGHARNENLKKIDIYALGAYANKIKYQIFIKIFEDYFLNSMLDINPEKRPDIRTIIRYLEGITIGELVFDFNFTPTSIFNFANLPPPAAANNMPPPPPPGYTRFGGSKMTKSKSRSRRHGRRQKKRKTRR